MKNIIFTFFIILLFVTVKAQSPNGFKYQAVIYNSDGDIVSNEDISIRISLLEGDASGSTVYQEVHDVTTNVAGLISVTVGNGTTTDDFSAINWSADDYFIKIEVDVEGGTSYMNMGTTQLLSVPYAMHAQTADSLTGNSIMSDQIIDGPGSGLDADLLDGHNSDYYLNASNINAGSLGYDRYNAWSDLNHDGFLDNNSSNDILTRSQSDYRYNREVGFHAYSSISDHRTSGAVAKIDFSYEKMDRNYNFTLATDQFTAPCNGLYSFSVSARVSNINSGSVSLLLYVNNVHYLTLSQMTPGSTNVFTVNGTTTIYLSSGDNVDVRLATSADNDFYVSGSSGGQLTWFCGHLISQDL